MTKKTMIPNEEIDNHENRSFSFHASIPVPGRLDKRRPMLTVTGSIYGNFGQSPDMTLTVRPHRDVAEGLGHMVCEIPAAAIPTLCKALEAAAERLAREETRWHDRRVGIKARGMKRSSGGLS